tara:strand:+ start:1393 stop:2766 length:1374 start_codon:yes stop_codon:yes gene_type:complete
MQPDDVQGPSEPKVYEEEMEIINSFGETIPIGKSNWVGLRVEEDIYRTGITGELYLLDAENIAQQFDFNGQEKIKLKFGTPSKPPIVFEGRIYAAPKRRNVSDSSAGYAIPFISAECLRSQQIKVRQGFVNEPYSDMVTKIYERYMKPSGNKPLYVEPTLQLASFSFPGWTPIKTIRKLATKSVSADVSYRGATYLFFERLGNGKNIPGQSGFLFVSLEALLDPDRGPYTNPAELYRYEWKSIEDHDPRDFTSIIDLVETKKPNTLDNITKGMYSSTLIVHDIVKGTVHKHKLNYAQEFDHTVGGSTPLPYSKELVDASDSYEIYTTKKYQNYGGVHGGPDSSAGFPEGTILQRHSNFQQMNNLIATYTVPGDSLRRVGDIVQLELPSPETVGSDGPKRDSVMSGRHFVTRVVHNIDRTSPSARYETTIQSVKRDSVGDRAVATHSLDPPLEFNGIF